jgi:hypothetical protein
MDDRTGQSNAQKTIKGLSLFLPKLKEKPFIMSSSGTKNKPNLIMKAPYFQGSKGVNFNYVFNPKDNFCFYIFANNFKETFSSHALVGWWRSGELILFDPNGDFWTPEPDSVYNGYGYFIASQVSNLKNPLYNTLLDYFKLPKVKVYQGAPIPCPREKGSCVYRALMFILAIHKTNDPIEVIRYTSKMAKSYYKEIKDIAETAEIYEIFQNESILDNFRKFMKKIDMDNSNSSKHYKSI